jgi:hypothetical protein
VGGHGGDTGFQWDFFVSYAQADREWAEWIAWRLEAAGHRVLVQAWHMVAGVDWAEQMAAGLAGSAWTVAVVSPTYLESKACKEEWLAAWRAGMQGKGRRLLRSGWSTTSCRRRSTGSSALTCSR